MEDLEQKTVAEEIVIEENEEGGPSGFSLLLNKFFHHLDRGSTLGREIAGGIIMFLLAICVLFVNIQIISSLVNGNIVIATTPKDEGNIAAGLTYVQFYIGALIISVVGSLLIGLLARLPFIQISTMGLATSLLGLVSVGTGLSYYNLLFISFIASIIYAVIAGVPFIRNWIIKALPNGVKKALPVALGLILVFGALRLSGLVNAQSVAINPQSANINAITYYSLNTGEGLSKVGTHAFIGVLVAVISIGVFKALKVRHSYLLGFVLGTVLFLLINLFSTGFDFTANSAKPESVFNFGRIWIIMGSSKEVATPYADSYLTYVSDGFKGVFANFGKVFSEGSNFSSYSGNTIILIISLVLTYVLTSLFDIHGTLVASEDIINKGIKEELEPFSTDNSRSARMAYISNAGVNVIAPLFGVGGVTLSKTSFAGQEDGARSGIAPIVACVGFIASLFILIFPALLATSTYAVGSMNEWNYFAYGNGGFIYLVSSLTFGIADAVLALLGISMMKSIKNIEFKNIEESIPALITIVFSFVFSNIALGAALGIIAYALIKIFAFRENSDVKLIPSFKGFLSNFKTIELGSLIMSGIMLVFVILTLI